MKLVEGVAKNPEMRQLPKNLTELIENIAEMIENQIADSDGDNKLVIGIGCAGSVSFEGQIQVSPNVSYLEGVKLVQQVSSAVKPFAKMKKNILLQNDVTAAAFGEYCFGSLPDNFCSDFIYLAFGTGIGAGRILEGKLQSGAHNFWGEVGHIQVSDSETETCGCGRRGCWEQLASGTALGKLATSYVETGRAPKLKKELEAEGIKGGVRGEDIGKFLQEKVHTIQNQDLRQECQQIIGELANWMAAGIKNLINICDPGCIVLGGGMLKLGENLLPVVVEKMRNSPGPNCDLIMSSNIDWGGALGAAEMARLQ